MLEWAIQVAVFFFKKALYQFKFHEKQMIYLKEEKNRTYL